MAPRKSPARKSPARKVAGKKASPVRKPVRKRSAMQRAHTAYMKKQLLALAKKSPNAKQTTLMKRAAASWMKSAERARLVKAARPASPARKSARRTPVQAARARFMKSKRASLRKQMPRAQPKTIQKRANAAWMRSPERKRLMKAAARK